MLQEESHLGIKKQILNDQLNECFSTLLKNEIDIAVIVCNTLHAFLEPTFKENMLFVHLIEETAKAVRSNPLDNVLILCSTTLAKCQLHKNYFECTYLAEDDQLKMQDLIDKILAGQHRLQDAENFLFFLNHLPFSSPKEKVGLVLGCTEFSVFNEQFSLTKKLNKQFTVFDPTLIVAERICTLLFNSRV